MRYSVQPGARAVALHLTRHVPRIAEEGRGVLMAPQSQRRYAATKYRAAQAQQPASGPWLQLAMARLWQTSFLLRSGSCL